MKMLHNSRLETREDFVRRLRANAGYIRLTKNRTFDPGRLRRLEEACWKYRGTAPQSRFASAPAKRALFHLQKLRDALGNPDLWLSSAGVASLDLLEHKLKVAAKAKRGRPSDTKARVFRQTMDRFIPESLNSQKMRRAVSRAEIDEIFAALFTLVFGREVSAASFTRMRVRDRSR